MDIYESPQPSTSEAEDIVEDSEVENNPDEFSNQQIQSDTNGCSQNSNAIPSPELLPLPKPKVKRHKRPPDPSDPVGKKSCLKKIIIVELFFYSNRTTKFHEIRMEFKSRYYCRRQILPQF